MPLRTIARVAVIADSLRQSKQQVETIVADCQRFGVDAAGAQQLLASMIVAEQDAISLSAALVTYLRDHTTALDASMDASTPDKPAV